MANAPLARYPVSNALRWLAVLAAMHIVLALPDRPDGFELARFLVVPAELFLLAGLLFAAPPRWRRPVRLGVALALTLLLVLKIADIAMFAALGRPFNAVLDIALVGAGLDLLGRAFGELGALLLIGLALALLAGIVWLIFRAFGLPDIAAAGRIPAWRRAGGLALVVAGGIGIALAWPGGWLPLSSWASVYLYRHGEAFAAGVVDLRRFRELVAEDSARAIADDRLLAGLGDADVLVVFVESYGRSVVDPATGDAGVRAALAELDAAVRVRGFDMRSAWLTSPVRGGQSWLAHASLLAGLPVDNQRRYDDLMAADGSAARATLIDDFARAGRRTVAVMPAIRGEWPDARRFGYDRFYGAADLGYRGAPFNWVTMPDQYTLAAFAERELDAGGATRQPLFAEIALISSHAPWTPVPPLLPWAAIGDGSVFTPYADAGDPPEVVWRDPDRVRVQYRKATAYVLRTLASFVVEHGRRDMLMVIVGDHQPVPFVSGDAESMAVPVHIVAGDPDWLAALDGWGWTPGAVPDGNAPEWPMAAFRARFLDAFSAPAPAPAAVSVRSSGPG